MIDYLKEIKVDSDMKPHKIAVGVVEHKDRILLLKRTPQRRYSPEKWQPVSGFVDEGEEPKGSVLREVREETGLEGKVIREGEPFEVSDEWGRWYIIPFLVSVDSGEVKIDREEHSEYMWMNPRDIDKFDCVAGAKEDLESVGLL